MRRAARAIPPRGAGRDASAAIAAAEAAHHRGEARGASADARFAAALRAAEITLAPLFPARDVRRLVASADAREAEVCTWGMEALHLCR